MGLFLKIIGILFLIVMATIVIGFFLIRRWLRNLMKNSVPPTFSTINLTKIDEADYPQDQKLLNQLAELKNHHFEFGGAFEIEEMPGMSLFSAKLRDQDVLACVYLHPMVGVWVDLIAHFEDGAELTVSSAPTGGEMDTRPECRKILMASETIEALLDTMLKEIEGAELLPLALDDFDTLFKTSYEKDMAWRNEQGGVSEEEVRRMVEQQGRDLSEEEFIALMASIKENEISVRAEECLENFQETTSLSVHEWKLHEDSMVIVNDTFHTAGFLNYLNYELDFDEADMASFNKLVEEGCTPSVLISSLESHNFTVTHLGSVSTPITAEIYSIRSEQVINS